ncbi:hypothetical protein [Brevundimonas sp. GCM10030266]|uniref:hypothetical protein n=1 Tax=Brevundimonas sp. GCM10030266 TaxID=3273386 RepID=UPI003614FD0F
MLQRARLRIPSGWMIGINGLYEGMGAPDLPVLRFCSLRGMKADVSGLMLSGGQNSTPQNALS